MSVDALRHHVERTIGLAIGEPTVVSWAVTGERYVTMTNGGVKAEGKEFPVFAESRAAALEGYIGACEDYARARRTGGRAVLYWRSYPSIVKLDDGTWTVYSRLLVSDKPVNAAAVKALAA